jgi:hypothetical protein
MDVNHIKLWKHSMTLTWETGLADFAPPPVQVAAFAAYPITWLVLDGTPVTRVQDWRMLDAWTVSWMYLNNRQSWNVPAM